MPNCPSRPSLHFNSICMSKAAESLRGNQPQRHSLSAQCIPGAAEASSAFGESESVSLYRSPMGGEESSYSNLVENASTHRGTVTHIWDNKYHRKTHDPPANWNQSMDSFPIHCCHWADSSQKANESFPPCFRRGYLNVWISVPCNTGCGLQGHREKVDGVKQCGTMRYTLWKAGLNWNT